MTIQRFCPRSWMDDYEEGAYVTFEDYHREMTESACTINKLKNQLAEAEKYKPSKQSLFAVRYSYEAHEGNSPELRMVYAHYHKHMTNLLDKLQENSGVSNIQVYALNEVEVEIVKTPKFIVKLPE